MNKLSLNKPAKPVVSRRSLTKGQATLYELIEGKVKNNQAITLEEAIKIYSSDVCREKINHKPAGWSAYYDHENQKYRYRLEELTEYEIKVRAMQWLMQAVGSLVMRGYLKVTPMISLGE